MRPIVVSVGPLTAASANAVAQSQSLGAAGALTLNGALASAGVATLPQTRRIGITSTSNDTALVWTIVGTTFAGSPATETLAGANVGTAQSALDYATISSIKCSAATNSAVTVGTTGVAGAPWVRLDDWALSQAALQCSASGTVNYTVQSTLDDPNSPTSPVAPALVNWAPSSDANVVAATATMQSNFGYTPTYVQLLINSGTGAVTMTVNQSGAVPY